jgi:hypothetical protein
MGTENYGQTEPPEILDLNLGDKITIQNDAPLIAYQMFQTPTGAGALMYVSINYETRKTKQNYPNYGNQGKVVHKNSINIGQNNYIYVVHFTFDTDSDKTEYVTNIKAVKKVSNSSGGARKKKRSKRTKRRQRSKRSTRKGRSNRRRSYKKRY